MSIQRFPLSLRLLLLGDVRTLRTCLLGLGLPITIIVMKRVPLAVKRPDVQFVVLSDSDVFHHHATKEYKINFSFNVDSSTVLYLSDYVVCGVQYVGSTSMPFRLMLSNYKACYHRLKPGSSVPQI